MVHRRQKHCDFTSKETSQVFQAQTLTPYVDAGGRPLDRKSANWPRPKGLAWKGAVCVVVRSFLPAPFSGWQRDDRAAGV